MQKTLRALCASAGFLVAASADAQAGLPDARTVLARYAQTTNAAKVATIGGRHITGTVEMAAQGLKGTIESYTDLTGRSLQVLSLAGLEIRTGIDSAFGWSIDPMRGPKLIEGQQFIEQREDLDPRAMRRDPALIVSATTTERTTVAAESCVKIKLVWKSGKETVECYSESTGLLLSKESTETSDEGKIATVTTYSEYKTFEGITVPTRTSQRVGPTELVYRITDVQFGSIDPAKLALPPEIKALRKQ